MSCLECEGTGWLYVAGPGDNVRRCPAGCQPPVRTDHDRWSTPKDRSTPEEAAKWMARLRAKTQKPF